MPRLQRCNNGFNFDEISKYPDSFQRKILSINAAPPNTCLPRALYSSGKSTNQPTVRAVLLALRLMLEISYEYVLHKN